MADYLGNLIAFLSPRAALSRARAAAALDVLRGYEAASRGKRAKGWNASRGSSESEILPQTALLRDRAREAVRNNPFARKAVRTMRSSVVGTGVRLSIRTRSRAQTDTARALWKAWAETANCDFYGRSNLYGLQRLIVGTAYADGEVFVRAIRRNDAPQGIAPVQLQVLEADYLDTSKDGVLAAGSGRISGGIELDAYGRKTAYYFFSNHPHDPQGQMNPTSTRIPASEVLHIYQAERPGQIRGVTELAASLFRLRDFGEYEDAQLIRQKIAACFTVFVHGDNEARPGDDSYTGIPLERVEPGMIEYLEPGKSVEMATPPTVENYAEYSRTMLQGAAAGAGITYEAMTGDLSNVNFSSGRMGWIEMSRYVREWQDDVLIAQMCAPVWELFREACVVASLLPARTVFDTSWTAPRREMIDPVKEVKGLENQLRAGLASWSDVVRELGHDPDVLEAEIAESMRVFDRIGGVPTHDPRHDAQRLGRAQIDTNGTE